MRSEWPALLQIAVDLTRSLCARDRYQRLLEVVRSAIACDATALLALQGDELVPLAVHGLRADVLGMRFALAEHPRLERVVRSEHPVRFPADSRLPDPFDGLVEGEPHALRDVHDCLGCPLVADGAVVGVLTADALSTRAFDDLEHDFLVALGALAGAALHTTRLIDTVEALADKRGLVVRELTRERSERDAAQMLGVGPAMARVRAEIDTVAGTDFPVLVLGETGVGKELAARAIHAGSKRKDAPLIHVNCAALPEAIVESELFGHVRGAFTGATSERPGEFEVADGGTLFLDEIGELPLAMQPKLLRALQEGEIQRVGSDRPVRTDVRIVAATNRDLEQAVGAGRFRADLYHRLHVYPLHIPPLRERREDIPLLAATFLDRHRGQLGLGQVILAPDALAALAIAEWPGNIRELDHVLARGALRAAARAPKGHRVQVERRDLDLGPAAPPALAPPPAPPGGSPVVPLREAVEELKRTMIERALAAADGNWAEAARRLGMHRSNLHHLAERLGLRE